MAAIAGWAAAEGAWTEELAVAPAGGGLVVAHLQFAASAAAGARHAGAFPPAVLDLARRHRLRRLSVTLARGHWSQAEPPPPWAPVPPPGLEVGVQFDPGAGAARPALEALAQALSGLVGAAVPALVEHGALAAPAVGWFADQAVQRQQVFGAAPQEALCSENLAAWLKLLPCRGQAGLAALLEPGAVLAAPLHSLQLLLEASPAAEAAMAGGGCAGDAQVRLTLGVTLVTQPEAGSLEAARTLEGVLAAALGGGGGGELPPPCPAAAPAGIFLPQIHPQGGGRWEVRGCRPSGAAWQSCGAAPAAPPPPRLACGGGGWQLQSCSHVAPVGPLAQRLTLTAVASEGNRSGGGGGGGGGGEALLHVMQLLPWELAVRWRTLRLTLEGREASLDDPAVAWHVLRPAVPRGPASLLELLLRLPAAGGGSRVALSLEFEPRLLAVDDYPPDASRGVDLPAALFTLSPPACAAAAAPGAACACAPVRRRGGVHLAALPIPDASMPFNVVCFTSTALALALGAALNVVLRSPAEVAAGGAGAGGGRSLRDRGRRLVAVLLGVGALAVYLDKELQRQAEGWLAAAGLGRPEL